MGIVVGIWLALSGVLPALAGLAGAVRARRLRRDGVQVWATAVALHPAGAPHLVALRYTLPNGRVIENSVGGKTRQLLPGERTLIWYSPTDPMDALVQGCEGHAWELAFAITGAALIAAGTAIAIAAP